MENLNRVLESVTYSSVLKVGGTNIIPLIGSYNFVSMIRVGDFKNSIILWHHGNACKFIFALYLKIVVAKYWRLLDPHKGYIKFFRFVQSNKELCFLDRKLLLAQEDVRICLGWWLWSRMRKKSLDEEVASLGKK